MKIVHLSPGSGDDFYCENCLRDALLVRALRQAGHDASVVPLYLPLMTGEGDAGSGRQVFFGGINVYLQQKLALFRRTPRWLDRLFDSPRLLHWAGKKAGMTSARQVGEMMLSMLRGEQGRQVKELDRLVEFLAAHERPDAVLISNALLVGMARRIKQALSVPVVCSLQDEEGYVESLVEPYRSEAWRILRRRADDVDAFIAPSRFYRDVMQQRLGVPDERLCVIHNAIDAGELAPRPGPPAVPAIGYLAQMCQGKGLDTLAEAFCRLKRSGRWAALKLRVFGGATAADEPFVRKVRQRIERAGLADDVDIWADFAERSKRDFLHACTVVSVPTRRGEAFGLFLLEAWACGVPVVLPDHGAFTELLAGGGGVLCPPNDPAALADALEGLLADADRAAELGRQGRQALTEKFTMARMARQAEALLERLCRDRPAGGIP